MVNPFPGTPPAPTQTRHPWRATLRTVFAAGVALASLVPTIAALGHVENVPVIAQVIVVAGAITRILANPGVNDWLARFLPFLAAAPK